MGPKSVTGMPGSDGVDVLEVDDGSAIEAA